ncbi:MAG: Yip1 family protein [Candidatus Woesearchaeota archaeon]
MLQRIKLFLLPLLAVILLPAVHAQEPDGIWKWISDLFSGTPDAITGKIIIFYLVFFFFWLGASAVHKSQGRERVIVLIIAGLLAFISTIAIPNEVVTSIMEEYSFIVSFVLMVVPFFLVVGIFALMHLIHASYGDTKVTAGLGLAFSIVALFLTQYLRTMLANTFMVSRLYFFFDVLLIIQIIIGAYAIYFGLQLVSGGSGSKTSGLGSGAGNWLKNRFRAIRNREQSVNLKEHSVERNLEHDMEVMEQVQIKDAHIVKEVLERLRGITINIFSRSTNMQTEYLRAEKNHYQGFANKLNGVIQSLEKVVSKTNKHDHRLHALFKREARIKKKQNRLEHEADKSFQNQPQVKSMIHAELQKIHGMEYRAFQTEVEAFDRVEAAIHHIIEKQGEHIKELKSFNEHIGKYCEWLGHALTILHKGLRNQSDPRNALMNAGYDHHVMPLTIQAEHLISKTHTLIEHEEIAVKLIKELEKIGVAEEHSDERAEANAESAVERAASSGATKGPSSFRRSQIKGKKPFRRPRGRRR